MDIRCITSAFCFTLLLLGCGADKDKPIKVSGTVLLDGKPLAGASVRFMRDGGSGPGAYGESQEDGTFQLTSFTEGDGALPGDYRVLISWEEPPPPSFRTSPGATPSDEQKKALEDYQEKKKKRGKPPVVPSVYKDPTRSPLKQTVPPRDKVEFRLESSAK